MTIEPSSGAAVLSAPTNLTATASTPSGAPVVLQWTGVAGATSYQVERTANVNVPYSIIGTTSSTTVTFTDQTAMAGTAYLYRVRAMDAGGGSAPSNVRLAVAAVFTDPTLASGVTQIKAAHITELRAAINSVRQAAGLAAASWTDANLSGAVIRAVHVEEMRTRLTEALTSLGMSGPAYTDATLANVWVKRAHIEELRLAINASGAGAGGGTSSPVIARDGFAYLGYNETNNRITSANFQYDAAGNQTITPAQTDSGQQRMEYDAAGRLVKVRDGYGAQLAAYTYGASNQRLIAEEGGQRTYYAATGGSVLAEYTEATGSSTPQWRQSYVYLGGRLLATVEHNGGAERTQYHHPDRLGTRLSTNQHDQTTSVQATLPFGTVLATETASAPSTSRRFTTYDRSSVTRLDYAVNRHYDPLQGRFTTVDPIDMESVDLSDPQTLNLYAYCANDPINRVDPDGLGFFSFFKKLFKAISKILKWIAIAAFVATAVLFIFAAPLAGTVLGKILAVIAGIPAKIGSFVAGIPKTIAGLFGFAESGISAALASAIGNAVLLAGSEAFGAVSRHMQQQEDRRRRRRGRGGEGRTPLEVRFPARTIIDMLEDFRRPRTPEQIENARRYAERIRRWEECAAPFRRVFEQRVADINEDRGFERGLAATGGALLGLFGAAATRGISILAGGGMGAGSVEVLRRRDIRRAGIERDRAIQQGCGPRP